MSGKWTVPLLLLLMATVYVATASDRAIMDDGDALYASVARQMVVRGDWVTPYADGVRFLDKPPMMYWLMGISYLVFGVSEFAARFPSALAVIGVGCLLCLMGRKHVNAAAGFFAGLAVAFCVGTFLFTRMVFPDIIFVFFLTLSLHAFLEWYADPSAPRRPALLMFASLAGAVLTKGLIGVVFPAAIVALFLALRREWGCLKSIHAGLGILLFLGIALPWHALAAIRNPGFLWYFFVNEQWLRFLGRRQPVDYESIPVSAFWALLLIWFFPWSAFLPAIRSVFRECRSGPPGAGSLAWLALSWIIVILTFFTFSSRIEHYALPLLPPLALLAGISLSPGKIGLDGDPSRRERWVSRGFGALALLGGALGLVLLGAVAAWAFGHWGDQLGQGEAARHIRAYNYYFAPVFDLPPETVARLRAPLAGTCLALFAGFVTAWWLNRRGRRTHGVSALTIGMMAFCFFAFQSLGICEDALSSRQFGRVLDRLYKPGDTVITFGDFETANSINFYSNMPLDVYGGTAALLHWGLTYPDAPRRILSASEFEARWRSGQRSFLLVPDARVAEIGIFPGYAILRAGGRILFCNRPVS